MPVLIINPPSSIIRFPTHTQARSTLRHQHRLLGPSGATTSLSLGGWGNTCVFLSRLGILGIPPTTHRHSQCESFRSLLSRGGGPSFLPSNVRIFCFNVWVYDVDAKRGQQEAYEKLKKVLERLCQKVLPTDEVERSSQEGLVVTVCNGLTWA